MSAQVPGGPQPVPLALSANSQIAAPPTRPQRVRQSRSGLALQEFLARCALDQTNIAWAQLERDSLSKVCSLLALC